MAPLGSAWDPTLLSTTQVEGGDKPEGEERFVDYRGFISLYCMFIHCLIPTCSDDVEGPLKCEGRWWAREGDLLVLKRWEGNQLT